MPRGSRSLAAGALIAITVAGCGTAASVNGSRQAHMVLSGSAAAPPALPAGWRELRLSSGGRLPYPAGWRPVSGDPGSSSAALVNPAGTVRAYLNATPATANETLAGWLRFRVRHNAAEGDRHVRLISAHTNVRLDGGRASCVVDDYATSRSKYRELACVLAPANQRAETVLVAAAQSRAWTHNRPQLEFAINHFTS